MNSSKTWKRLTALTLLFSLCSALLLNDGTKVQATGSYGYSADKCSPDIIKIIQSGNGNTHVRAIVQSNPTSGSLLDPLVQTFGGVVLATFPNLNARLVDISADGAFALASDAGISYMSLDGPVRSSGHITTTTGAQQSRFQKNALRQNFTLDGSGLSIAVLDSGIDTTHKSFPSGLIKFSKDFTGQNRTDDPYGHGTHVAALALGDGVPTSGKYEGIAPAANLVNLRVLDSNGNGTVSNLLRALDWVFANRVLHKIRVVNMSLGTPAISSYKYDPICRAVRKLVDAGVVVVAAAGNNGKTTGGQRIYGGIHSPGNEPSAITVGATNSYGTDRRSDDTVASYSSRGPTRSSWTEGYNVYHYDNMIKPDLVAPGNKIIAAEAVNNYLVKNYPLLETNLYSTTNMKLMYLSGTSMSSPMVAGAAAMLLEVNPNLTPNMVKMILMYTAQPLAGFNTFEQGAGQLNIAGAVALAKMIRTDVLNLVTARSLGSSLLTQSAPTPQSTISGSAFPWAQGLVLKHATVIGNNLITKYQMTYGRGYLLGDGVKEDYSYQSLDRAMWTGGVSPMDYIMTSNGTAMGGGGTFCPLALLLGYGMVMADGVVIGDAARGGVVMGDATRGGVVMGDATRGGVVMGDATLEALSAMLYGE